MPASDVGQLPNLTNTQVVFFYAGLAAIVLKTFRDVLKDRKDAPAKAAEDAENERIRAVVKSMEREVEETKVRVGANHDQVRKARIRQSHTMDALTHKIESQDKQITQLLDIIKASAEKVLQLEIELTKATTQASEFKDLYVNLQLAFSKEQAAHAVVSRRLDELTEQNEQQGRELAQLRTASDVKAYQELKERYDDVSLKLADAIAQLEKYAVPDSPPSPSSPV